MITTGNHTARVSVYKITREGPRHMSKNIVINNTVYCTCNDYYNFDGAKIELQLSTCTFDDDNEWALKHVQTFSNNEADEVTFGTTKMFLTLTTNNGHSWTGVPSKVYKWDPEHCLFNFIQSLETIYMK